ncbi:MAG: exodeoxyribonuclease VII small subunit [Desulfuromonadales bacterium]|nr:exodeoxyribonuclease VII small subunit [Desulfuromonadales bacterium]NOQ52659.1 exodeoxyribonuclease VII small subunit [Desulfuromonadaceae bacterium]
MATKKGFEAALQKLEKAVTQLEGGELTLDQSLKIFAEGVKQADVCRQALSQVELQVEQLLKQTDGRWQREAFENEL